MAIRILDNSVASKIAAGEVVERPVSVVKELLENSLDAGASQIIVEIFDGDINLIRVTDDGYGISPTDIPIAFERHATSKIANEGDLEGIETMGFRGEALPSIAAVSNVVLTSRCHGSDVGATIRVRGGEIMESGASGGAEGTSVAVEDLFFNVPARKKFLRSSLSEKGRIRTLVAQMALAYPEVRFQLRVNERQRFLSPGSGKLQDTIAKMYDSEVLSSLLDVAASDGEGLNLWGCISAPSYSRVNRGAINFYVNRRLVQSRLLGQAVEQAYLGLLMSGRHPLIALHLELPFDQVDVNVHPAKKEVRFYQEGAIFSFVQRAAREILIDGSPVPTVRPAVSLKASAGPGIESLQRPSVPEPSLHREFPADHFDFHGKSSEFPLLKRVLPALRAIGQIAATYIIAEGPAGVYLIDQHAAHERVLFERVRERSREPDLIVQGLMEPISVELLPAQMQAAEIWHATLEVYGFQGEPFGGLTFLLRGIPSALSSNRNPENALIDVLDLLSSEQDPMQAGDSLAASIACHSAIRAGDLMAHEEMGSLLRQLEDLDNPHTCPHGRPTMLHLSTNDLEREFGRR